MTVPFDSLIMATCLTYPGMSSGKWRMHEIHFDTGNCQNEITVNSRGLRKTKHKKQENEKHKTKTGQETKSFRYELYKYIIQSNSQFTKATWAVENQNRAINANPNLVKSRHHKFRGTSLLSFVDFPLLFLSLKSRVLTNFGQTLWFVLNCGCG